MSCCLNLLFLHTNVVLSQPFVSSYTCRAVSTFCFFIQMSCCLNLLLLSRLCWSFAVPSFCILVIALSYFVLVVCGAMSCLCFFLVLIGLGNRRSYVGKMFWTAPEGLFLSCLCLVLSLSFSLPVLIEIWRRVCLSASV
jgi:hypothetical protein